MPRRWRCLEQAKPKRVVFVQCDAEIHEWETIEGTDDLFGRKLKGGGGSRTEPVFERIEEEGNDRICWCTSPMLDVASHRKRQRIPACGVRWIVARTCRRSVNWSMCHCRWGNDEVS